MAGKVTVPVDVGVGPALHTLTGPVAKDQAWHSGLVISVEAVVDKKTIRKYRKRIPKEYREQAMQMDEVRISPSPLIPDTILLSPKVFDTGLYGLSWRPLSLGVPLLKKPFRVRAAAGLRLTAAVLHSDTLPSPVFFFRPGVDVGLDVEIPLSKKVLVSFGWDSQVYIPQALEGGVLAIEPLDETLWHVGQAYVMFHYRFPYKVKL